jgi:micrococcal nuclease
MYEYKCELVRVVDGDTIDCSIDLGFKVYIKERVRLAGIDTPESRTRNKVEKTWGLAAKYRLQELLEDSFVLRTEIQKKGKFGRILGTIIVNDKNINEMLVEEKLAIPYHGKNKKEAREKYGVLELWSTPYLSD